MDIAADKSKSVINQTGPFLSLMRALQRAVKWLAGLVILTDEDRKNAGIYNGGEDRDG